MYANVHIVCGCMLVPVDVKLVPVDVKLVPVDVMAAELDAGVGEMHVHCVAHRITWTDVALARERRDSDGVSVQHRDVVAHTAVQVILQRQ